MFCDGLMLAMVRDDALYFRVDDDNRTLFKEAEAFPPLNYEKGGGSIDLAFWRAPERLFDEPEEFLTWARAAASVSRRHYRTCAIAPALAHGISASTAGINERKTAMSLLGACTIITASERSGKLC